MGADRVREDRGALIGMSVAFPRLDLEAAARALAGAGFTWLEVHFSQVASAARTSEPVAAYGAVADELAALNLRAASLNVVGRPDFAPFDGRSAFSAAVACLAEDLRRAAALRAQRVLIWDGFPPGAGENAAVELARCIREATEQAALDPAPEISVECHPFTFALRDQRLEELAAELYACGAGICLDFCHFGVALGADFLGTVDPAVLQAVNHIHFADTDCSTPEFHLPPGEGCLDFAALAVWLTGRPVAVAWDTFGWPAPRRAMERYKESYAAFVQHVAEGARIGGRASL